MCLRHGKPRLPPLLTTENTENTEQKIIDFAYPPTFFKITSSINVTEEFCMKLMRLVLFVFCAILLVQSTYAASIQREFQVSPGQELRLNLKSGGDITIEGWDKPVV